MNIMHFVNFFNGGGSTKTCLEHVAHMPEHNHVFIGSDNGVSKSIFKTLGPTYTLSRDSNFNYAPHLSQNLIEKHEIDLIHFYLPGHENPTFLNKFEQKKLCTVLCGQKIGFGKNLFDHVRFISEYQTKLNEEELTDFQSYSVVRCGLGPDQAKFRNPNPKAKTCFGRVSAFCPSKRIMDTVQCAKVFNQNPFIIAGHILDVAYFESIISFIRDNNMKNVQIEYNIDDFQKEAIYNKIDVLHYPTENEAFCYSIVEGMQRTKPVISYDNSAIPELDILSSIDLVESGNIEDLIEKTRVYVDNPAKIPNAGLLNREVYEKNFTSKIYTESMGSLYEYVRKK